MVNLMKLLFLGDRLLGSYWEVLLFILDGDMRLLGGGLLCSNDQIPRRGDAQFLRFVSQNRAHIDYKLCIACTYHTQSLSTVHWMEFRHQ